MKRQTLLLALVFGMSLLGAREAVCIDHGSLPAASELSRRIRGLPQVYLIGPKLTILGTRYDDHVEVNNVLPCYVEVVVYRSDRRRSERFSPSYPRDVIGSITFDGENGNDNLWTEMIDVPVYAWGGNGNDRLEGGANKDFLYGGSGDDDLYGGDGEDMLFGNDGDDDLYGGDGEDMLFGDDGDDDLYGAGGDDQLSGGKGKDCLYGGADNDHLIGDDARTPMMFDSFLTPHYETDIHSMTGDHASTDTLVGGPGEDEFSLPYYTYASASWREAVGPVQYDNCPDFRPGEGDFETRTDILVWLP